MSGGTLEDWTTDMERKKRARSDKLEFEEREKEGERRDEKGTEFSQMERGDRKLMRIETAENRGKKLDSKSNLGDGKQQRETEWDEIVRQSNSVSNFELRSEQSRNLVGPSIERFQEGYERRDFEQEQGKDGQNLGDLGMYDHQNSRFYEELNDQSGGMSYNLKGSKDGVERTYFSQDLGQGSSLNQEFNPSDYGWNTIVGQDQGNGGFV